MSFKSGWLLLAGLFICQLAFSQEPSQVIKKVGIGLRVGATQITADELSKKNQKTGPLTSIDIHYNVMGTVELLGEVSYGWNEVDFLLGEAHVTRIFEEDFIIGFRFYPKFLTFNKISTTFTFGAGFYRWFYTQSDGFMYKSEEIQTFRGEDLLFNSVGLNTGLGFRYHLNESLALDGTFRYHFIQSKDNRGKFGGNDKNEQSFDIGIGVVYLFSLTR